MQKNYLAYTVSLTFENIKNCSILTIFWLLFFQDLNPTEVILDIIRN